MVLFLDDARDIEVVGGPTVTGNCVVFTAVDPTTNPDVVSQFQFTASLDAPSFLIAYEGLIFRNFPNNSLGEALIEGSNGNLIVSNIGSSGQDGVAVEMGTAGGWDMAWDALDPGGILPESASVAITGIGQVGGAPNHPIGTAMVRKIGTLYELSADFSPVGATSIKVLIYNDNVFVDSITGITATQFATADGCLLDDHWGNPVGSPPIGGTGLTFLDPRIFDFGFKDSKVIIGDELWIIPENPAMSIDFLSRVEIRASRIPAITLTNESALPIPDSVAIFGFDHNSLGTASIQPLGGGLVVNNIGSSGNDGVAVRWVDDGMTGQCPMCPKVFNVAWDDLESSGTLPDSAEITVAASGRVDGIPDRLIGIGRAMKLGSDWQISADFSPIGNTTQKILVLNGGVVVDSAVGHTGPAALAAGGIRDWHWEDETTPGPASKSPSINHPGGCTGTFLTPVLITILPSSRDSRAVMGDAIMMIPENHTLESQYMDLIEIKASDIPTFTITSESGEFDFICGDADGSASVDISDAVFLIQYIFSGGPAPNPLLAGDADCSGSVDISDAVYLIQYIFSGGPAPCNAC